MYIACLCFLYNTQHVAYAKSVLAMTVSPMLHCRHVEVLNKLVLTYVSK